MEIKPQHILKFFAACFAVSILSACSLESSIESITKDIVEVIQEKKSNNEIVAASQQGIATASGYRVQSSVGYHASAPEVVTSGNYKVTTSAQGNFFKE